MAQVLNAREVGQLSDSHQVYVGRPSKWGNQFKIGRDGTRDEVIAKYRAWIAEQPELLLDLHELIGKDLVCWCSPKPCHADVLLALAGRLTSHAKHK